MVFLIAVVLIINSTLIPAILTVMLRYMYFYHASKKHDFLAKNPEWIAERDRFDEKHSIMFTAVRSIPRNNLDPSSDVVSTFDFLNSIKFVAVIFNFTSALFADGMFESTEFIRIYLLIFCVPSIIIIIFYVSHCKNKRITSITSWFTDFEYIPKKNRTNRLPKRKL